MKDGRRILEEFGYRIAFRRHRWTECLVWSDSERWHGHGGDETDALRAVLEQMFPSAASSKLMEFYCQTVDPGAAARSIVATESPMPDEPRRVYSRSEALEALNLLSDRIDAEGPELALMSPTRQRMVMLSWICRARAWEDRRPGDSFVARQVANIARKITLLGKLWWPGSVRSLHVNSSPADAVAEAGMAAGWPPRNWSDASLVLGKRLGQLFERDAELGRDDYGWIDAAALVPAPSEPDRMLREVAADLSSAAGSLLEPARTASRGGYTPRPGDEARLASWARRLRWIRGAAADFSTWGAAMGRLRWLALQSDLRSSALGELLDPDYSPPGPWSEHQVGSPVMDAEAAPTTHPLIVGVRGFTEGLRALLVCSPEIAVGDELQALTANLEEIFGLAVSVSGSGDAELSAALSALGEDDFDVLMLASRFGDFTTDMRLALAARQAKTPYVRLFRCLPLGSGRALAQQIGLQLQGADTRQGGERDPGRALRARSLSLSRPARRGVT